MQKGKQPSQESEAANSAKGQEQEEAVVYVCPNCGAEIVTDPTTAATNVIIVRARWYYRKEFPENISYCSLVISREVFFVSEGHRKPETYRANLCD